MGFSLSIDITNSFFQIHVSCNLLPSNQCCTQFKGVGNDTWLSSFMQTRTMAYWLIHSNAYLNHLAFTQRNTSVLPCRLVQQIYHMIQHILRGTDSINIYIFTCISMQLLSLIRRRSTQLMNRLLYIRPITVLVVHTSEIYKQGYKQREYLYYDIPFFFPRNEYEHRCYSDIKFNIHI